jgi:hypothetical protein
MVIGDLNAKIGKQGIYHGTIGEQSLRTDSNDNGQRIIDFVIGRNMVISSTCFPHKSIFKGTWRSPDGRTCNPIDHILIDRRNISSMIDVGRCDRAEGDPERCLVKAVCRCRIMTWKNEHLVKEPKINIRKLEITEILRPTKGHYKGKQTKKKGNQKMISMMHGQT